MESSSTVAAAARHTEGGVAEGEYEERRRVAPPNSLRPQSGGRRHPPSPPATTPPPHRLHSLSSAPRSRIAACAPLPLLAPAPTPPARSQRYLPTTDDPTSSPAEAPVMHGRRRPWSLQPLGSTLLCPISGRPQTPCLLHPLVVGESSLPPLPFELLEHRRMTRDRRSPGWATPAADPEPTSSGPQESPRPSSNPLRLGLLGKPAFSV
ncbi:hypothetical protein ZWY2020_037970 [Hordeum vulgare]|nr:hypothetical protein ZWY2020_037970 [Hordeum vulgare]